MTLLQNPARAPAFLAKSARSVFPPNCPRVGVGCCCQIQRPWRASRNMATLAGFRIPTVANEPNKHYAKGSPDRQGLLDGIKTFKNKAPVEVPLVVGGKHVTGVSMKSQYDPSDHDTVVANYSNAGEAEVKTAIESALAAKESWEALPFADRAAVFLKAADLVSTKYRYEIMAATMVGQGKNAWQAEIDAAAELCDFFRFNVQYAEELYSQQPVHHAQGVWNRVEYRPLEGFVYAISPFNFTAIGGNLPAAPALVGNVVLWKPSDSAIASNWLVYSILLEAGLPPNVIQFVPGDAPTVTKAVLSHPDFAALHFTGSTAVFRALYAQIAKGVGDATYRGYPRIVGETGGKNFHLLHPSADVKLAAANTVRGAFEYQGQKCSATSRAYVPKSLWPAFKEELVSMTKALKVGPPDDMGNFIGPVIHKGSFEKLQNAIEDAKKDSECELLVGGICDSYKGWYIYPTIFQTTSPHHTLMKRELFGPVLAVYVYDDTGNTADAFDKACKLVESSSEYALTGAVFAQDREAIRFAEEKLRNAAGNFYVNCKSTGAVVAQQPFGGARASGTNDKAGSANLLARFVSMRSIKEEFAGTQKVEYPSNEV